MAGITAGAAAIYAATNKTNKLSALRHTHLHCTAMETKGTWHHQLIQEGRTSPTSPDTLVVISGFAKGELKRSCLKTRSQPVANHIIYALFQFQCLVLAGQTHNTYEYQPYN